MQSCIEKKTSKIYYFAINIAMIHIKYPIVMMYWFSQNDLKMDLVADATTLNRIAEVKMYIHFADNNCQCNSEVLENSTYSIFMLNIYNFYLIILIAPYVFDFEKKFN